MEIDHVEAFVAIVRGRGFTRASAALHLSQPAISRRIRLLEREVGAPLFERLPGGARLTAAGDAFLPHAEALLAAVRDAMAAVEALRSGDVGMVALAAVGTLASSRLTGALQRFRRAHPAVDLRLRTALSREVTALVRRGDVELGLRYNHDPHLDVSERELYRERLVPVCSAAHPLARRRTVPAAALRAERWITFPPQPGRGREPYVAEIERGLAAAGVELGDLLLVDSLTAQKRLVEAGFGLGVLQESSIEEELRAGTLRELRVTALHLAVPVVLVHRRRAYLSGAARELMQLLAAPAAWPAPPRTPTGSRSVRGRATPRRDKASPGRRKE